MVTAPSINPTSRALKGTPDSPADSTWVELEHTFHQALVCQAWPITDGQLGSSVSCFRTGNASVATGGRLSLTYRSVRSARRSHGTGGTTTPRTGPPR